MPVVHAEARAVLSDMDGTLCDSTFAVEAAWHHFAKQYPFLDVPEILKHSHGVRTVENMRTWCKLEDPQLLESETARFERAIVEQAAERQARGEPGLIILPGVNELLTKLDVAEPKAWAIVTSATKVYAHAAVKTAGIKHPDAFVTAEWVQQGKPMPDPYLKGAELLGVPASDCIVLEDAPSGIRSGKAAGAKVIAVLCSHDIEAVKIAEPDFIVKDLSDVSAEWKDGKYHFTIKTIE